MLNTQASEVEKWGFKKIFFKRKKMGKKGLVIRITLNVSKATLELEDNELCLQNSNSKLISTEANHQIKYENRMPTFSDIQSLKKMCLPCICS